MLASLWLLFEARLNGCRVYCGLAWREAAEMIGVHRLDALRVCVEPLEVAVVGWKGLEDHLGQGRVELYFLYRVLLAADHKDALLVLERVLVHIAAAEK